MNKYALQISNVSKSFGNYIVHEDCDLSLEQGKFMALIGPSGVGKSVLLKYILGFLKPDQGNVMVKNWEIDYADENGLQTMRSKFGVVFQGSALLDSLNVYENVALPLHERSALTASEIKDRAFSYLDQLNILNSKDKFPSQISGGMKRRVALARSLMLEPDILLFDEPTTGLDPATSLAIYELFLDTIQKLKCSALMITHDIPNIFSYVDEIAILEEKRISQGYNKDSIFDAQSQWLNQSLSIKKELQ